MKDEIEALSDEAAQRAVLEVWDRLATRTAGGTRPSQSEVELIVTDLEGGTNRDVERLHEALVDSQDPAARAVVARLVLLNLADDPGARDLVREATEAAASERLAPIPLIIGAVLLILATVPKNVGYERQVVVGKGGGRVEITKLGIETRGPKEVVEALGTFITSHASELLGYGSS